MTIPTKHISIIDSSCVAVQWYFPRRCWALSSTAAASRAAARCCCHPHCHRHQTPPPVHRSWPPTAAAVVCVEWGVPVTPAAHYTCGGMATDLNGHVVSVDCKVIMGSKGGMRQCRNLYAAGEATRTGLHGGNCLASTSLLEGLVFGSSVGDRFFGFWMVLSSAFPEPKLARKRCECETKWQGRREVGMENCDGRR